MLDLAADVKAHPETYAGHLAGRSIALIFEKPSTRTRVSFEVGVAQMGAHPVVLSSSDLQLGRGETIEDTGKVLSRYVDAIVLRTFEQERLEVLARAASVPVVNSLSDFEHPCQALADLLTVRERLGSPGRARPHVPRGRQQRGALAPAGRREGRHARADRDAGGVRADPAGGAPGRGRSPPRRAAASRSPTTREGRDRRRRAVHGRVGQHGPGGRDRRARPGVLRLPAGRQAGRPRAPTTSSCSTACRPTGARRSPPR